MCICCCMCNCCNSYSSKCVEFCTLVLSTVTFVFSILWFVFMKWSHLTIACSILLILLIFFASFTATSTLCINIFRYKGVINKNKNLISTYLAIISLSLTIIIFVMCLVAESLVQTNFRDIDYPCKDLKYYSNKNSIYYRLLSLEIISDEQRNEFCKDKAIDYNAKICSNLEYTMAYISSTVIECCTLILCFFWYNDYRRIREKIDGELPIYDNTYITQTRLQNVMNFKDGDQLDPSERYMNQNQLVQSNIVLVKNVSSRKSQQYNINRNKEKDGKNFIRDLRREMQEAIESIEEESSENKEDITKNNKNNKNKEVDNIEDLLYSEKNSNNSEKKSNDNNNNINEKKSNVSKDNNEDNNNNIIFIDEENKDVMSEENPQKNDISINNNLENKNNN